MPGKIPLYTFKNHDSIFSGNICAGFYGRHVPDDKGNDWSSSNVNFIDESVWMLEKESQEALLEKQSADCGSECPAGNSVVQSHYEQYVSVSGIKCCQQKNAMIL